MDNVGYVVAAYVATFVVLGGYTGLLWRRLRQARRTKPAGGPPR